MQKIISVFQRNYDTDRLIRNEIVPGAEWVVAGEGVATRKWDGSCCMIRDNKLYKRYELKPGKTAPDGFEPAQDADATTGGQPGWVPVGDGPEDQWFRAALVNYKDLYMCPRAADGTYEAVGPHFGGGHHEKNPERFAQDLLVRHGWHFLGDVPRDFDGLREWLRGEDIEGVVFHHPDGRMAKVKKKDYGLARAATAA